MTGQSRMPVEPWICKNLGGGEASKQTKKPSNCLANVIWVGSFPITFITLSSPFPENDDSHLPHQLSYLFSFLSWPPFLWSVVLWCCHGSFAAQIRSVPIMTPGKIAACNSLWQAAHAVPSSHAACCLSHRAVCSGNFHPSTLTLVGWLTWLRTSYFPLLVAKGMETAVWNTDEIASWV